MYICICNCLKEKDICSAITQGACSVGEVYRSLGCKPQCGKCVEYVRETFLPSEADATAHVA